MDYGINRGMSALNATTAAQQQQTYQPDICIQEPPTRLLPAFIDQVECRSVEIFEAAIKLRNMADVIFGPVISEGAEEERPRPPDCGLVDRMQRVTEYQRSAIEMLEDQIRRFAAL